MLTSQPDDLATPMADENRRITETITRERVRLARFIRRHVADAGEAEDILQDVFFAYVEAYRLPRPIEQAGAWLLRVARNRIIDRFRRKREEPLPRPHPSDDGETAESIYADSDLWFDCELPASDEGPEADYLRTVMLEAVSAALAELPAHQRDVFIAHELDGLSFKELAGVSGVGVNTLLGWKRQAVLQLRARLQPLYDEFF